MRRLRLFVVLGLWSFAGCSNESATAERAPAPGLGLDIFGVLCDRVGAQALHEDLTGASYSDICHGNATKVDTTKLPAAPDANVRRLAIGKIEALGAHKPDLVAALNTVFPDDIVVGKNLDAADPVASCDPISSKTRRDQLRGLLTRLLPTNGDDTIPDSSRAAAVSIEPLTSDEGASARTSMTHLGARRGYMPPETASGLLGSVLTAPRLRDLLGATMSALGPESDPYDAPGTKGKGYGQLHAFISAVQQNITAPVGQEAPLAFTTDTAGRTVPSRPRTTIELGRSIALTENQVFSNGAPLWVTKRDPRGMAVIAKDASGHLPAPFVDANSDGLPDLDANGHFALGNGGSVEPADPFSGDNKSPIYEYTDARATAASATVRHLAPLADPDGGKESVMNGLEGFEPLLREQNSFLDIVQALGQASADPSTDDALALVGQLFTEQPQLMARVTGALLDAKAILDAHPEARLPDGSTLFDDLTDDLVQISAEPGLLEDVLTSMSDDRAQYIATAIPALMTYDDQISYDPNNVNGLPINLTVQGGGPPETLVDRTQPNTGLNRSIFQRFLQLLHDTRGVTFCNKDQAILFGTIVNPANGQQVQVQYPISCDPTATDPPAPCAKECELVHIEDLSRFYMRAMIGQSVLQFRPVTFNAPSIEALSSQDLKISTSFDGFWDNTAAGRDPTLVYPTPQFLNRQVFFKIDPNAACATQSNPDTAANQANYSPTCVLDDLQGLHIPSSECASRSIVDPTAGDDGTNYVNPPPAGTMVNGLRTCQPGQNLDERDPNTIFALEYNHGYDAFGPLTETFVKHNKDDLLVALMDTLNTHWSVEGGVAAAEPALAEILKTDLVPALGAMSKITNGMSIKRCVVDGTNVCATTETVPASRVLADGIRAMIDPTRAQLAGVTDRRGGTTTKSGKPISILGMLRDALNEEDTVLGADKTKLNEWQTSRSHFVDEFLTVNGRGTAAQFADAGVAQLAPVAIELIREQRLAKCAGDPTCPALRKQLALDIQSDLTDPVFTSGLDLLDVVLGDTELRGEIGRMTAYMFRQSTALGGASTSASSTPFAESSSLAPGALDQSISALVDALGGLGDLSDVRGLYAVLAKSLDNVDPELSLLARLNARAYDANGNEICAKELDPEEAIRNTLARLSMTVTVPGKPTTTAIQIFLDSIADVNRLDATINGPIAPADYQNVFVNLHDLLTDPQSGLEQLYASVKNATAK